MHMIITNILVTLYKHKILVLQKEMSFTCIELSQYNHLYKKQIFFLPIYVCISTGVEPCHGQIQSFSGTYDR
jgi:hypothetical protein